MHIWPVIGFVVATFHRLAFGAKQMVGWRKQIRHLWIVDSFADFFARELTRRFIGFFVRKNIMKSTKPKCKAFVAPQSFVNIFALFIINIKRRTFIAAMEKPPKVFSKRLNISS